MKSDVMKPEIDPRWGTPNPVHDPYVLANFKPRSTDVLITTAPKAGTTWMQQILHQLRSGGDESFQSINDVVPWLERPRPGKGWREMIEQYEAMAEPRLFKTHCTYEQTPGGVETARIILSSRDPRDCCVSFYHHLHGMTDEARQRYDVNLPADFDEHVERWLGFAAWYRNVQSWWPYHDHPNVLWLRYQDMKRDLAGSLREILAFLGRTLDGPSLARVEELCSIGWMRAHQEKFASQAGDGKPLFKPGGFVRQGKVGDYKSLMTAEHEARILAKAREMLSPQALAFLELD